MACKGAFSGAHIGNSAHPAPATTAKAIRRNGDMEGKGSGPHAWKASQLPNGFGSQTLHSSPRSPDVHFGLGGRTQASAAAARDALLRHPPAPALRRANAPTRNRVRSHRQAIHFVLAPAASQDG